MSWQPPGPGAGQPPNWSPQPPNGQYQHQPPHPSQQLAQQRTPVQPNGLPLAPVNQQQPQQQPPSLPPPQGGAPMTLQPSPHDQYPRLPPPNAMYPQPYQQAPQIAYGNQPAPRQRTAIACRYCRRRKIRCSGFDQSEDGRCTNCQRFSQECVFTPVSAQTQAFVPAHTVYRGNPPPNTQLYGAYGQPLPQHGARDAYAQPQQQPQQPGQYPPPPQGYQQQPPMYQQQSQAAGAKRPNEEPHTPTLPPPGQGPQMYPEPAGIDGARERMKDVGVQVNLGSGTLQELKEQGQ